MAHVEAYDQTALKVSGGPRRSAPPILHVRRRPPGVVVGCNHIRLSTAAPPGGSFIGSLGARGGRAHRPTRVRRHRKGSLRLGARGSLCFPRSVPPSVRRQGSLTPGLKPLLGGAYRTARSGCPATAPLKQPRVGGPRNRAQRA